MKQIFVIGLFLFVSFAKTFGQNNYTDSLKHELTVVKSDTSKVLLLWDLSNTYLFAYADTSTTYLLQGMQLSEKINDKTHQGGFMNLLCVALANQGNFIGALDIGLKGLTLGENAHDTLLIIYSNNNLMHCYRQQGEYKEALRYGNRAVSLITRPPKNSAQASTVYGIVSSVFERNNQLDSALYFGELSYKMNPDFSEIYPILGDVYSRLGRQDTALHFYRMGIPICLKNYSNIGLIKIYNGMSKIFESFGKMDSAIYYAHKSIFQEGIRSYPEGVLHASIQLASLYESKKAYDSIIKYLKLGNAIRDSLFSRKKIRETQNYEYNEAMNLQKAAAQKREAANKMKTYALLSIISVFLIIGIFLWRNNLQKQKVNALLHEQKHEIQTTLSELKSTQAQLIESEKMASLGELTTGIAHEIQNPLNFVNNFSEVNTELIDELKFELNAGNNEEAISIADDIRENQQKISQHGKRAEVIVKGMLQHTRISTGLKELTDIKKLTEEYLRLSYQGFRSKDKTFQVNLQTDFDESAGKINIVPQDIGRVLMNLFNNAFYSVKEKKQRLGDLIQSDGLLYEPTVFVRIRKIGDRVELMVKDNGNGIPHKLAGKIFQPFFTTKPPGKGTGLGLSLSYDIIKAHLGEIRVETKESEGASFISLLPIS